MYVKWDTGKVIAITTFVITITTIQLHTIMSVCY